MSGRKLSPCWEHVKVTALLPDGRQRRECGFCGLIMDPAIRALTVAIQSADVERVCKAHKVIHTKSRNLLANKTVQMLLFAYCNLRLLKMCPELMRAMSLGGSGKFAEEEVVVLDEGDDEGDEGSSQEGLGP